LSLEDEATRLARSQRACVSLQYILPGERVAALKEAAKLLTLRQVQVCASVPQDELHIGQSRLSAKVFGYKYVVGISEARKLGAKQRSASDNVVSARIGLGLHLEESVLAGTPHQKVREVLMEAPRQPIENDARLFSDIQYSWIDVMELESVALSG